MPLTKKRKPRRVPPRFHVGEWIARLGRKPVDVAKNVDITESYLSEVIANKKVPSVAILLAIADELGVTTDALRRAPPSKAAVEAATNLEPGQIEALGQLLDRIRR